MSIIHCKYNKKKKKLQKQNHDKIKPNVANEKGK